MEKEPNKHAGDKDSLGPIWMWPFRFLIVAALFVVPWDNGMLEWRDQRWIAMFVLPLVFFIPIVSWFGTKSKRVLRIPGISLLLLAICLFAWLQTVPVFTPNSMMLPNAVKIQAWFLGAPVSIQSNLLSSATQETIERDAHLESVSSFERLPISHCVQDTKCSMASLGICALLIWFSSLIFADRRSQSFLLHALGGLGLLMSLLFFAETVSSLPLGIGTREGVKLIGTFANKNTAGAFLSVCLAASVGLTANAFKQMQQTKAKTDVRYRLDSGGAFLGNIKSAIDFFGGLQTIHILYCIMTITLFASVVLSLSRGAAISCVAASIVVLFFYSREEGMEVAIG